MPGVTPCATLAKVHTRFSPGLRGGVTDRNILRLYNNCGRAGRGYIQPTRLYIKPYHKVHLRNSCPSCARPVADTGLPRPCTCSVAMPRHCTHAIHGVSAAYGWRGWPCSAPRSGDRSWWALCRSDGTSQRLRTRIDKSSGSPGPPDVLAIVYMIYFPLASGGTPSRSMLTAAAPGSSAIGPNGSKGYGFSVEDEP